MESNLQNGRGIGWRSVNQSKTGVSNTLNEARILVLVGQVLIGFQYISVFEPGFDALPPSSRWLRIAMLALLLLAVGLLLTPASYHRLAVFGEGGPHVQSLTTRIVGRALLPFAISLGVDFYVAAERVVHVPVAIAAGLGLSTAALGGWYGVALGRRARGST